MSIGKNQITRSFVATNFSVIKDPFFMQIKITHIISKKCMLINVKNGQSIKSLWIISWKWFSHYVTLPPRDHCQVQIIRFITNTLHQRLVNFIMSSPGYWQTGCLWWEAVESWFLLDLVIFCIEKQFPGVLTWSHYSMVKCNIWIVDEMDMTPLQVGYSWGKFQHRLKYLYTMEQLVWGTWMSCSGKNSYPPGGILSER